MERDVLFLRMRLNFGKHKGKLLAQLDDSYLEWLTTVEQEWMATAAIKVLERRNPMKVLSFGSHKGKQIDQVDDDYLRWMLTKYSMSSWWGRAAVEVLKGRDMLTSKVDIPVLLADLKACGKTRNLEQGQRIHAKLVGSGKCSRIDIATAVINMYAKSGSMVDARQVFDGIKHPDVVSWNALLLGYADNGDGHVVLDLFARMRSQGCTPDSVTYVAAFKACSSLALKLGGSRLPDCLEQGKQLHLEVRCPLDVYAQNTLVNMYAKCGSMDDAHQVFNSIRHPDVVSWTALLSGYAERGECVIALNLFSRMKFQGCVPDSRTYVAVLKACASLALMQEGGGREDCLELGKQIHSEIGSQACIYVQSTLIDMYAKCGSMVDAQALFDRIWNPDVVSWTALLLGYADNGAGRIALDLFSRMKAQGCVPDSRTFAAALKACATLGKDWLERGKQIHAEVGCHASLYVQSALVDMYGKCGSMSDAHQVFETIKNPDVVSWTALLLGYADNGRGVTALDLFSRMKSQGCAPNSATYVAVLKACASMAMNQGKTQCLQWGKEIHLEIGCRPTLHVQNALMEMYAKCGSMADAREVFDAIEQPSVVSWTTLLLGYADNGEGLTALDLFSRMKSQGCSPDSIAFAAALKACALLGDLEFGREIHAEINEFNSTIVTSLVDFYAKCGSLMEAQEVFDLHSGTRDLTTWTALLAGYSSFGESVSVFRLFERMQDAGFQPDGITFQCILMCCSHAGLVEKAWECFERMPAKYGVTPAVEHYACMIDVLGRANKLDDAILLLQRTPFSPDVTTWMTLLGACCKWKNVEVGRLAFQSLVSLDGTNAAAHVLMAHIYAGKPMRDEQAVVLAMTT